MSARAIEAFLARLYTDDALRRAFLADPGVVARKAGLDARDAQALEQVDREGLELAADSFAKKRASHAAKRPSGTFARMRRIFAR